MGALEKIQIKVLKETVIQGYDEDTRTVITLEEQTYMGENIYKIFSITKYDGKIFNLAMSYVSYDRKKSEKYFSKLEEKYPGTSKIRKIF